MSDSDSEYDRPRWTSRRSPQATRIKHGELYVHKDYEGRFLLCFSVRHRTPRGRPTAPLPSPRFTKRDTGILVVVWHCVGTLR